MPAPIKVIADYFLATADDTNDQSDPDIVGIPNGRLFFAYSDGFVGNPERKYVVAQAGQEFGNNITLLTGALDETNLAAAFTPAGYNMRVWTSRDDATGTSDIFAEIASPSAQAGPGDLALPFLVNTDQTAGNQVQPQVAATGEGRFLVTWIDLTTSRLRASVIDASGNVDRAPFDVSTSAVTHANGAFEISIAVLQNGSAVIAYRLNSFDTAFVVVISTGFASSEFDYDGITGGTGAPAVVALADGRFAIVTSDGNGNGAISGRIFETNGTLSVDEFNVLGSGDTPKALALPDGRFLVAAVGGGDIVAQMMKADGTKDGASFIVNSVTTGAQSNPDLALLADGRIGIAWQTSESGNNDIKVAIFDPREAGVEVIGTALGDIYVGSAFDDVFVTGAGADVVAGNGGNDQLRGGVGNDMLTGGLGADILDGGSGIDTASYDDNFGGVFVNLTTGRGFGNAADGDVLIGIENLRGSSFNDTFVGNAAANRLEGLDGDDVLIGALGADVLVGGNGNDTASYEDNQGAVFVNLSTSSGFGNAAEGDRLSSIENLRGGVFDDVFIGDGMANRLEGAGGDDILIGGLGADILDGGAGNDTASYEDNQGAVVVNILAATASGNAAQGDVLISIENLRGSAFADTLSGDNGVNRIAGGGGVDTLTGFGGADSFVFDTAPVAGNADTITDFVATFDRIELASASFRGLTTGALETAAFVNGPAATTAAHRIVYNGATGQLFFDADGSGAGAAVLFATLQGAPAVTAADFLVT